MNLHRVNRLDGPAFLATFGGVFEHSPWVAERAYARRPFAGIDALHGAMVDAVRGASRAEQIALLCAHPDLAGREALEGTMTDASVTEQSSAGLDRLSRAEMQRISELNGAYRAKHGFPFIIAVLHYTKAGIFHEFSRRLSNDTGAEIAEGLAQVFAITRMRLSRMCAEEAAALERAQAVTAAVASPV